MKLASYLLLISLLTFAIGHKIASNNINKNSRFTHRATGHLPQSLRTPPTSTLTLDLKTTASKPDSSFEKRQEVWPWQRAPHVIGAYPDGRLKCRIMSMTAGHTEGPCPPKLTKEQVAKMLRGEWCRNNCCTEEGKAC